MMQEVGLTEQQLAALIDVFQKYPAIEKVKLYGSRAKGSYGERSDIDLVAYGEQLNRDIIALVLLDIEDSDIPYQVDLQDYHELKNKNLIDHIDRIGFEIYRRKAE